MALRLLEIILPEEHFNDVAELLKQHGVTDYWQTCSCESKIIFKIILQDERTEELTDQFERKYNYLDDFRLILFPLEASYPRPEQIERESAESFADKPQSTSIRVSRQELYNDIFDSSKLTKVFLIMVFLSTI